ncbi:MAG: hypothetical protein O2887_09785 [Bacteroidetes bacterium]|nr:hypothetical protein [Bacteroidota bacterium]
MIKNAFFIIFFTVIVLQVFSQKIKYKDIFVQLDEKRYETTEPYLRTFVFDPKNDDHGNAHLQMGYIFESKLLAADILADSLTIYGWADSAIIYFSRAKLLIDEKELKKNDEYYQSFYRRDLRSGEFGIKISDVHLDLDNKIEAARQRSKNITIVNKSLKEANLLYNQAVEKFLIHNNKFSDFNLFLLRSNKQTMFDMSEIVEKSIASEEAIAEMRRALSLIENPGFGAEIKFKPIGKFPESGVSKIDFYQGEFDIWELGNWAGEVMIQLENDIEPLRSEIMAFDTKLTETKANLFSGGLGINMAMESNKNLIRKIVKYDPKSVLNEIFQLRVEDINVLKTYAPDLNSMVADHENIDYQLIIADSVLTKYAGMDTLVTVLASKDIDNGYENYKYYFDARMGGKAGLQEFISDQRKEINDRLTYWESQKEYWGEVGKWGVMDFGAIPLFTIDSALAYPIDSLNYLSLHNQRSNDQSIYSLGLDLAGAQPKGYIASVAQNRKGKWSATIDLGRMTLGDTLLRAEARFVPSDTTTVSAYYFSPLGNKDNLVIFNVDQSGKLVWRNVMALPIEPFDVKFNEAIFETIVYLTDPAITPTDNNPQYIVIDRAGKVR